MIVLIVVGVAAVAGLGYVVYQKRTVNKKGISDYMLEEDKDANTAQTMA